VIRLHDDLPGLRGVTGPDDESSFSDVWMLAASMLQHATQVHFVEPAVLHAFQQVGGQLQFPCPPRWPLPCRQNRLVLFSVVCFVSLTSYGRKAPIAGRMHDLEPIGSGTSLLCRAIIFPG